MGNIFPSQQRSWLNGILCSKLNYFKSICETQLDTCFLYKQRLEINLPKPAQWLVFLVCKIFRPRNGIQKNVILAPKFPGYFIEHIIKFNTYIYYWSLGSTEIILISPNCPPVTKLTFRAFQLLPSRNW